MVYIVLQRTLWSRFEHQLPETGKELKVNLPSPLRLGEPSHLCRTGNAMVRKALRTLEEIAARGTHIVKSAKEKVNGVPGNKATFTVEFNNAARVLRELRETPRLTVMSSASGRTSSRPRLVS